MVTVLPLESWLLKEIIKIKKKLNMVSMLLIMCLKKHPIKIDRLYSVHRKPCWSCIQRNITKANTIGTTAAYMLREVSVFWKLPELRL